MTLRTKTILMTLVNRWSKFQSHLLDKEWYFACSVYDWLAFLVDHSGWNKDQFLSTIRPQGLHRPWVEEWTDNVLHSSLTISSLVGRHYLVDAVLTEEIMIPINFAPIHSLMMSMMMAKIYFGPIDCGVLWAGIDHHHPVNSLRRQRPIVQRYRYDLAMRNDVTDHRLVRDHALLSSLSLIYGLYLVQIILNYQVTIRPDPVVSHLKDLVTETIVQLKGVLDNVEDQSFGPHV